MTSHNDTDEGSPCLNTVNVHDINHPNNTRNLEVYSVPLIVASILLLILLIVLAVTAYNLESYTPIPCQVNVPANVSSRIVSTLISEGDIPHTDYVCSYNTSEDYLETLIDDLSEYCKPTKTKDLFDADLHQCSGDELYIPLQCMCDSKQQCPGEMDISRKQTCSKCSDERHCPCQNNGTCSKCIHGHDQVACLCKQGTSGKYCTKITQRTCRRNTTITNTLHCNNTNKKVCFIQEPSNNQDYICEWSVNLGQYPPCFTQRDEQDKHKQTVNADPLTDAGKDNVIKKEGTLLKTSKTLIWISFILTAIIFICVVGHVLRAKVRFKILGQYRWC